jgi:V-type H+-transporting ATPase subunit H
VTVAPPQTMVVASGAFYSVEDQPIPLWYADEHSLAVRAKGEVLAVAADFSDLDADFDERWSAAGSIEALLKTAKGDVNVAQYTMHGIYEVLRTDVTLFAHFDDALKKKHIKDSMAQDLELSHHTDPATADKVAWLHSALIGHLSHHFEESNAVALVQDVCASSCTILGKVEAITNLLKSKTFRAAVFAKEQQYQVLEKVKVEATSTQGTPNTQVLYKCVFAYWMLSFEDEMMSQLKGKAVQQMKTFLTAEVKAEKVVRMSLVVLENFLNCKALSEDIAHSQIFDAVSALEYEKWRDAELYDTIKKVKQAIDVTVKEVSNFDRYLQELDTGTLSWGALHTSKFWAENCSSLNKSVVEKLKKVLDNARDKQSMAVACNDLGEIAVFHKEGKSWIQESGAKSDVMKRMENEDDKILRREALLCCQKIMLNKWQDIPQK